MPDLLVNELPVGVRRASDNEGYEIGVTWGGVFVPVGYVKAGDVEPAQQEVKQREADAAALAPTPTP
jgi:hypothetical protein